MSIRRAIEVWLTQGFDMSAMDSVYFKEGLVEVVDEKEIVTNEAVVRVSLMVSMYSHGAMLKAGYQLA